MELFTEIGKKIKKEAKPSEVNVIHPFIEVPTDKKLSIIGEYDNNEEFIVNGVGKVIPFVESEYYYGLNSKFGADEVCTALENGVFKDSDSFEKFIDANADLFTLPKSMQKYARALYAKTLVKMSTMFGFHFKCKNEECYDSFCKIASSSALKDIDYDINKKEKSVRLLGHPSEEFLKILDSNFCVESDGELNLKTELQEKSLCKNLIDIPFSLVQGKSYYSGVLPRVKKFVWCNNLYSNSDVKSIVVIFGRSTFATMDAFDSSYIKNHRLLKEYKSNLEDMDKCEDNLLRKYFQNMGGSTDEIMQNVNAFLEHSYSAHNLAVSGNIITDDGYVILAKRGKKAYDSNTYYCSVNGQSEICDNRVDFYRKSVYEDMPTIHIDNDNRIDFMAELERETNAELNIFCPASHWNLRGISFLTIINPEGKSSERRRFHFNILGECNSECSLSQIIESQKKATEKFENSKIIGLKIKRYKNLALRGLSLFLNIIKGILKSKELVTSLLAIAIFFIGFNELKNSELTVQRFSSIISIIFTISSILLIIINIVVALINYFKRKSTHFKFTFVKECKNFYKNVHLTFARKKINFHPIADLMLYEHIKYH